jgi:hypothetical protein
MAQALTMTGLCRRRSGVWVPRVGARGRALECVDAIGTRVGERPAAWIDSLTKLHYLEADRRYHHHGTIGDEVEFAAWRWTRRGHRCAAVLSSAAPRDARRALESEWSGSLG